MYILSTLFYFLSNDGFTPHGFCLNWRQDVFWTQVLSDALTAISYFSIPLALVYFSCRVPKVRYAWLSALFGLFIIMCGSTHAMDIWTLWSPDYGIQAIFKALTALASVATAIALWIVLPKALTLPTHHELTTKNREIQKLQERYRTLINTAGDGIHIVDGKGVLVEANDTFLHMLGYDQSAIGTLNVVDWDTQDDWDIIKSRNDHLIQSDKGLVFETKHRTKTGGVIDVEISAVGISLDGSRFVLAVSRDITQRKRITQDMIDLTAKLMETQETILGLENNIPDSYLYKFTRTLDGVPCFPYISNGISRVNGLLAQEVIKTPDLLLQQIDPDQIPEYSEMEAASKRDLSDFAMTLHMKRVDGAWRWIQLKSRPKRLENGQVIWHGIATDITDRHLLEAEIGRLAQAVEQNPSAIFMSDTEGELVYANQAFINMSGKAFYLLYKIPLHDLLSPELSAETFESILANLSMGRSWNGLLRNKTKTNKVRWEQTNASPIFNTMGQITHYLFLKQDVTEREDMIGNLGMASKVFETSNEALVICDQNNTIIKVNPAFTRITGYTEQEAKGRLPNFLASGKHDKEFYADLWTSVTERGEWSGEIWNRRKNGSIYPEWLSISTIRNQLGEIQNYVAIFSDITGRKEAEEKINYLAHFDPLTGLPNRTLLDDRVKIALGAAQRRKDKLAVIFLDLDRFKNVNDSLGHIFGDKLLKEVACRLQTLLREEDTISRVGGDEFIVIIQSADAQGAAHVATKILEAISSSFKIDGHDLNIGVSIGIAIYPENGSDFNALSQAADTALYRAKQMGRNNYQFFTDEMHETARDVLRIESALRRAVVRNELLLHYQPQYDITGKHLVGVEALVRWQHPELGLIPPSKFIPIAEESGLILDIGKFVLQTAVKQQVEWMKQGLVIGPIAVNLSQVQFFQPGLCDTVAEVLDEYGLPAHFLELELTESMAMGDIAHVIQTVDRLNDLGVMLSIDDFGTGYSSLSYLKKLRAHKLKIDQSFVRDIDHDPDDEAIVNAIIGMARNFNFTVIAEGVETNEQLSKLQEQGCDQIQGYFFSKPLPAADFAKKLLPPP